MCGVDDVDRLGTDGYYEHTQPSREQPGVGGLHGQLPAGRGELNWKRRSPRLDSLAAAQGCAGLRGATTPSSLWCRVT